MRSVLTMLTAVLVVGCAERPAAEARPVLDTDPRPTGDTASAAVAGAPVRSGVLLGLYEFEHGYETLWIAGDGDSVAVLARGPGLLVPRADGFWWIERPLDCGILTAGPAAGWPAGAVTIGHNLWGPPAEYCIDEYTEITVEYVGGNYIAVHDRGDAPSGRAVDSWDERLVMSLDSLGQDYALPLERFLAPAALARLDTVAKPVLDSLERAARGECAWRRGNRWTVRRTEGAWQLVAHYDRSFVWCSAPSFTVPGPVPAALVAHDGLSPDWATISAALPRVWDAVSSPGGDLVIVQSDSLYAFRVAGGALGSRTALAYHPGQIVMAEWALGRHVARWTAEVGPLLARSPVRAHLEPAPEAR